MAETNTRRATVTVACKMPHGLHLQLSDVRMETPPQGGREVAVHFPMGDRVTLAGANAGNRDGANPDGRSVAGYGLTEVDAEFWSRWVEQNKAFPPLVKGLLFAQPTQDKAEGQAREQSDVRAGTEPLNQGAPAPGIERV